MDGNNLVSIRETALRCKQEGIQLTECGLRRLAQSGDLPACRIGKKTLLCWENVLDFIRHGNNAVPEPQTQNGAIRRQA